MEWNLVVVLLLTCLTFRHGESAHVLGTFRNTVIGGQLRQMVRDPRGGHIFVGAINRIYDLTMTDLKPSHSVITGPVKDNINCQPHPSDPCRCSGQDSCDRYNMDSVNQALAVDKTSQTLIACNNLFYGSCMKIRISDFRIVENVYRPVVSNDVNDTTGSVVMMVAPGINSTHGNLYVGATRSQVGSVVYLDQVPMIASRKLVNFDLASKNRTTETQIQLLPHYKEAYFIYFRQIFSYNGFTYFLTVQEESLDSRDHVTRLRRICQHDTRMYSYAEIPLQCNVNGENYNAVQSAYLGKPGNTLAEALDVRGNPNGDVLFVVFSKTGYRTHNPLAPSALCVYSMQTLELRFLQVIQECFNGRGMTGPEVLAFPIRCEHTVSRAGPLVLIHFWLLQ